ncbi:MAG: hypothetical protein ABIQ06_11250 [Caldimonas sp.]
MPRIRALTPALVGLCSVLCSLAVAAQTASADPKRAKVDVRAMVPGPQASNSDSELETRTATGLTRDQRKEAALQARRDGALRPAGDAADLPVTRPAPLVVAKRLPSAPSRAPMQVSPPDSPAPPPVLAEASPPARVAAVPPAKKSARKKPRTAPMPA